MQQGDLPERPAGTKGGHPATVDGGVGQAAGDHVEPVASVALADHVGARRHGHPRRRARELLESKCGQRGQHRGGPDHRKLGAGVVAELVGAAHLWLGQHRHERRGTTDDGQGAGQPQRADQHRRDPRTRGDRQL